MKDSNLRTMRLLLFLFMAVGLCPYLAEACPTCKELVVRGVDAFKQMKFGRGIAWSMVLFFCMPLVLVGGMIFAIIRVQKKQKKEHP